MRKCNYSRIVLCVLAAAVISLVMGAVGCGTKDDPPPKSAGYYDGPMKNKSIKGQSDTTSENPPSGGVK